jgi:cytochrome d ubiquinol oxidase subunit II
MDYWLPLFFTAAMGLALLIYVILDGYDLGIGLLLPLATEEEKDLMIASIGPFWDANETWIVLGVGILLIAFPGAHGIILSTLYLPVTLMLIGLIMRGIAFDFRVKAENKQRQLWNRIFWLGSLLASASQGWMLGAYITGLNTSVLNTLFALLLALSFPALYIMLGCSWLMLKVEGDLFCRAINWARRALVPLALSLVLISIATPLVSPEIASRWFVLPNAIGLLPIPMTVAVVFFVLAWLLQKNTTVIANNAWLVFAGLVLICLFSMAGLAYSLFPDIIIGQMTIWEAASATESLLFTFWGTVVALPVVLVYTVFVYRIFHGKTTQLSYE